MKEINEAYDAINKMRSGTYRGGQSASYQGGYQQQYSGGAGDPSFSRVRTLINGGNLQQAEDLLQGMPQKNGEWYFLSGSIAYRKGWLDEAAQNFRIAVQMEPNNMEYRQALNMMQAGGQAYRPYGYAGTTDAMDCCTTMLCLNCLCGGGHC